jgi:hypothetical protein
MCNACGLRYKRYCDKQKFGIENNKKKKYGLKFSKNSREYKKYCSKLIFVIKNNEENKYKVCGICGTTKTPLWRKIRNEQTIVCNKCGLKDKRQTCKKIFDDIFIKNIIFENCNKCHALYSSYRTQINGLCMMCKLDY